MLLIYLLNVYKKKIGETLKNDGKYMIYEKIFNFYFFYLGLGLYLVLILSIFVFLYLFFLVIEELFLILFDLHLY